MQFISIAAPLNVSDLLSSLIKVGIIKKQDMQEPADGNESDKRDSDDDMDVS